MTDTAVVSATNTCNPVDSHAHQHGPNCGHRAIEHGDHLDYLHDGHLHRVHGAHVDECDGKPIAKRVKQ